MRILGLDPGTAILGWGLIDTGPRHNLNQATCVAYDCIRTDISLTDSQRLVALANGLEHLLRELQPDLVAVERLFFARNQKTVMAVSQARGVILLQIERLRLPVVEYTPLQVKQALTGYGKADKKQIQEMVRLLLRLPGIPKPDDAADALAIALTAGQVQVLA
jgi:crossover junction endodeoxyribonuclease RuvC